jgi:hypothetical protein
VKGLDLIDFNYPQHIKSKLTTEGKEEIMSALQEAGLKCGKVYILST